MRKFEKLEGLTEIFGLPQLATCHVSILLPVFMAEVSIKMLRLVTIISISTFSQCTKQICPSNSAAVVLSAVRSLGNLGIHFGITNCRMFRWMSGAQFFGWPGCSDLLRDVEGSVLQMRNDSEA